LSWDPWNWWIYFGFDGVKCIMNSLFIMYKLDGGLQCNFYMTLNANPGLWIVTERWEKKSFLICEGCSIFCWKKGRTSPIFLFVDYWRAFNLLLDGEKKTLNLVNLLCPKTLTGTYILKATFWFVTIMEFRTFLEFPFQHIFLV
jgi:hypothetical protein